MDHSYSYDDADKLTSISGSTPKTFTYDPLAAERPWWRAEQRPLTTGTGSRGSRVSRSLESRRIALAYNGLEARVSKADTSGSKTYKRNGASVITSQNRLYQSWYRLAPTCRRIKRALIHLYVEASKQLAKRARERGAPKKKLWPSKRLSPKH